MSRARTIADFGDGIATADIGDGQITTAKIASGAITDALLPAGSVLQVVQASTNTRVNISSSSYQDTGLSASITPTSATSKILVLTTQLGRVTSSGNFRNIYLRLVRNSTEVFNQFSGADADAYYVAQVGLVFLDNPATTSSVTYKTQGYSEYGGGTAQVTFQYDEGGSEPDSSSSIILMEIAG
jgi:hypothetical protein